MRKITDLFLIKHITNKQGLTHFKRWVILSTPWFAFYIHYIARKDDDDHPHSHPWNFRSWILSGGYDEMYIKNNGTRENPEFEKAKLVTTNQFSSIRRSKDDYHKISELHRPTWTFVWTGKRYPDWGYLMDGEYVESTKYRNLKHLGKLKYYVFKNKDI